MMEFVVPGSLSDERLDRVVAMLTELPRSVVATMIETGNVQVDAKPARKPSQKVVGGEVLIIEIPDLTPDAPEADKKVDFQVVYEDDDIIVVNKPAGLTVHPGNGAIGPTLVNGLLARYPEIGEVCPGGDSDRPGIVHRLDSGTSGLMVVARTEEAHGHLVGELSDHSVNRNYLALVWGHLEHSAGVVDAPIGRSRRDRTAMAVAQDGKPAKTLYLEIAKHYDPDVSLVAVGLETGRTHQIRVHMRALGHSVVGDPRYGGIRQNLRLKRPFLHAYRLGFTHPTTGEQVSFEAEPPTDLQEVLQRLEISLDGLPPAPG